jgi:hypothetical protein
LSNSIPVPSSAGRRDSDQVARLRQLAGLLDAAVGIPGTKVRFGLDSVLGLVPGVGDLVGGVLSVFIVISAARLGASPALVARMLGNIAVDTAIGTVPLLGDLFDVGWKANLRNVALIEEHVENPHRLRRRSRWLMAGVALAGAAILVASIAALMWALNRLGSTAG